MVFEMFVWISPKMLYSPILASFADSKLLDFAQTSASMTLRLNRTLSVACCIWYMWLFTPGACALGTFAKFIDPAATPS